MNVILDENLYNNIWNQVYSKFGFPPRDKKIPFRFSIDHKVYKLKAVWNEEQELIVNEIFKRLGVEDIYALDWQHDCFEYNPREEIPLSYKYYDEERQCNVYFPSYYPNGDFHFFISKDWRYGMLGHPWRKEIYVFGKELIELFVEVCEKLKLE